MDLHTATETAYKNGFSAGKRNTEIMTRLRVAYEQLDSCLDIIRKTGKYNDLTYLSDNIIDIMQELTKVNTMLGCTGLAD